MLLSLIFGSETSWIEVIAYIIAELIVIFLFLPLHECAHAFTAYKLGDKTAKYQGRLTLNPFAHIDYVGAFLMLVIGFGWAKPVPVDMRSFKNPKRDMAITALAGPVSNILIAFICLILSHLLLIATNLVSGSAAVVSVITAFSASTFYWAAYVNIGLAIFNLVPIPPLDGSRILNLFLSDRAYYKLMSLERYSFVLVIALSYIFGDALDTVINYAFYGISTLAYLPFSLFLR